jgi:hypothetical protein
LIIYVRDGRTFLFKGHNWKIFLSSGLIFLLSIFSPFFHYLVIFDLHMYSFWKCYLKFLFIHNTTLSFPNDKKFYVMAAKIYWRTARGPQFGHVWSMWYGRKYYGNKITRRFSLRNSIGQFANILYSCSHLLQLIFKCFLGDEGNIFNNDIAVVWP